MRAASGRSAQQPTRLAAAHLPDCFGELSYPPAALWYLGDPGALEGAPDRHVAIVGTREASAYGERVSARMAGACARMGLVVVSGLARGIDAAAHRAALKAQGRTIAVMGTGADVPYPAGHRTLHQEIQSAGAVISEMEPGMTAFPGCFPRRNRLIAALAKVIVVIEAGHKSGAMNTASHALQLGRVVAAVPGPIDDPRFAGSNQLIRDGSAVIGDVDDLLMHFGLSTMNSRRSGSVEPTMERIDAALLSLLGAKEQDLDMLSFKSGVSGRQLARRLLNLEMDGLVVRSDVGYRLAGS